MKYLDFPCPRCGEKSIIPPTKLEIKKSLILVSCSGCRRRSRYNIVEHVNNTRGYYLSPWGRTGNGYVQGHWNVEPRHQKLSSENVRMALNQYLDKYSDLV